jgi:hypothetical protein
MKRVRDFAVVSVGMILSLPSFATAQSVTYLPAPPDSWTYPVSINNNGDAIGYSYSFSNNFRPQGLRWVDGELDFLQGYTGAVPLSINDSGVIVGSGLVDSTEGESPTVTEVPVMWIDGEPEELPTLGFGGSAYEINNQGDIVGYVRTESTGIEPSLWRDGELIVLSTPGDNGGLATTIDDDGVISGITYGSTGVPSIHDQSSFLPTQWIDGTPKALPITFGASFTGSLGVNKSGGGQTSGYVIESRLLEDGQLAAIVVAVGWDGDQFRVLQKLDDNQSSWAFDVNALGVYAGYSRDAGGADVPVLWNSEGITRLPLAANLTARAVALNETGLVIGCDTTSMAAPVIWNINEAQSLTMPNVRGTRRTVVPLTARASDGNQPIVGQNVRFEVNGTVVGTATTGRTGVARMMYRVPANARGKIAVSASMNGMPSVVRAIEIDTHRSSAGVSGTFMEESGKLQLTASLNSIEPNRPVSKGRVSFLLNGRRVAMATTDSLGVAKAEITVPASGLSGWADIEVRYSGDRVTRPSTGRSSVEIAR